MATSMVLQNSYRTAANLTSKVVEARRIIVDTTNWNMRLGDGTTLGGLVFLNSGEFSGAITVTKAGVTTLHAALGDLSNVTGTPTDGQALVWNATVSKWQPGTVSVATSLASLTDVTLTTPVSGNYLRYNGTVWVNANIPNTSESITGAVVLATTAEVVTGTDTSKAVTCAGVAAAISAAGTGSGVVLSSATPAMDGTASAGNGATASRYNHVHPSDTSRAPLASPALTGTPTAPTAASGTNTTQIATTAFVASSVTAATPTASETVAGIVELATTEEVTAGTDTTRAVTPAGLASLALPRLSTDLPLADGTASAGVSTSASGSDHVHPVVQMQAFRNLLINTSFVNPVNQRAYTSGLATTAANQFTIDRWFIATTGQSMQFSGGVLTVPAGGLSQCVEGVLIPRSGSYRLSWVGTATATVNGTAVLNGGAVTLTAGTNAVVSFASGTLSDPQFEYGAPTPFEALPYDMEVTRCKRYFHRTLGAVNTEPTFYGYAGAGQSTGGNFQFQRDMRAVPVVSQVGTFALGNATVQPSIGTNTRGYFCAVVATATGFTVFHPNGSAILSFNAEITS